MITGIYVLLTEIVVMSSRSCLNDKAMFGLDIFIHLKFFGSARMLRYPVCILKLSYTRYSAPQNWRVYHCSRTPAGWWKTSALNSGPLLLLLNRAAASPSAHSAPDAAPAAASCDTTAAAAAATWWTDVRQQPPDQTYTQHASGTQEAEKSECICSTGQ